MTTTSRKVATMQPPKPTELKQDRSIATRQRLVQATIDLLCERGYAGVTTPDIAQNAGVSRGALQYHFSNKEDLFKEVIWETTNAMTAGLDIQTLCDVPIPDRVSTIVDHYWEALGSPRYVAVLEIWLHSRFDQTFVRRLADQQRTVGRNRDKEWLHLFSDLSVNSSDLVTVRTLIIDALRGFAMRRIGNGMGIVRRELDLLKGSVTSMLLAKSALEQEN
jgi:AcrR family transcriptional regulator